MLFHWLGNYEAVTDLLMRLALPSGKNLSPLRGFTNQWKQFEGSLPPPITIMKLRPLSVPPRFATIETCAANESK